MPIHPRLLKKNESGTALIELALTLPVLTVMLLGAMEVARYALINQKLDKAANSIADFATQICKPQASQLDGFAHDVQKIVAPFDFYGSVIFTSVATQAPNTTYDPNSGIPYNCYLTPSCITSQYEALGSDASHVGSVGSQAILPGNYTVLSSQSIVVSEIFFNYVPLLPYIGDLVPTLQPHVIYKEAVYKPRGCNELLPNAPGPAPAGDTPPDNTPDAPPDNTPDAPPDHKPDSVPDAPPDHTPDAPPDHTPDAPPDHTPDAPPDHTPDAPPDHTPDAPPDRTPDAPPDHTPDAPPDRTPDAPPDHTPDAPPDRTPDAPPDHTPDAPPDRTPDAPPDHTPDAPPDRTPDAPPDHTPDAPPDRTPGAPPDHTPDAPPDRTPDAPPDHTPDHTPDAIPDHKPDAPPAPHPKPHPIQQGG